MIPVVSSFSFDWFGCDGFLEVVVPEDASPLPDAAEGDEVTILLSSPLTLMDASIRMLIIIGVRRDLSSEDR